MDGPLEGDDDLVCEKLLRKYELIQKIGHSPWGVVWHATDKQTRVAIALKKLYGAMSEKKRAQMAYREVAILEALQGHDNIVELRTFLYGTSESDLYLVFGLMETDLYSAIRANVLKEKHFSYIMFQVLRALSFVHSKGFVHRDVKPSNVLIDGKCQVKLCDFGHARSLSGLEDSFSHNNKTGSNATDYTGSRWYRAPESVLGSNRISTAVDIWGAGCILGEMVLGAPVFPGNSSTHQLQLIIQLTGHPSKEEITRIPAPCAAEQLDPLFIGNITPKALSKTFENAKAEAIDILRLCLQFESSARSSALSLLKHPYMIEYYFENLQVGKNEVLSLNLNDNVVHSVDEYKHVIDKNIKHRLQRIQAKFGARERFGYHQDQQSIN